MKKLFLLALIFAVMLTGCSIETKSTIKTEITTTDADGNTTTTTTTTETGISAGDASSSDPTGLRKEWPNIFAEGAEGVSEFGYNIYLIYDNPEDIKLAAIMVLNSDNSELYNYIYGNVEPEDDHFKIVDVDTKEDGTVENMPFTITDKAIEGGGFEMTFKDGDSVEMHFVDQATIIDDMLSIWEEHQAAYQSAHQ